jgi:hypothetical protein
MAELPAVERKGVETYVNSQTRDSSDLVKIVQKIGARRIAHESYELYDVRTEQGGRWWVISEPMNLYSQDDFHSIDEAFTYHLGLRALLFDQRPMPGGRDDQEEDETGESSWFAAPLRTYNRAVQTMAEAVEPEDFQAVGIRCRETLISYVRQARRESWVPHQEAPPQAANFKAWIDILADAISTGKQRSYLKAVSVKTWDLAVWLQHYTDATEFDAEIVINATRNFLSSFGLAIRRYSEGDPQRCPQCESYRLEADGDVTEIKGRPGWASRQTCLSCGWQGPEEFEPFTAEYLQRLLDYRREVEAEELSEPSPSDEEPSE